jgi:ATP-dependent helicase HrpA
VLDALLKAVRERTQLAVQRNDFKLEQLQPHLLMNFRIVDEHGRQLGTGRHLASLKAELGGQARTAFQALAALKLPAAAPGRQRPPKARRAASRRIARPPEAKRPRKLRAYTAWTFGELPELMEIRRARRRWSASRRWWTRATHVEIEVFDEPEWPRPGTAPGCAGWWRCRSRSR